MTGWIRRMLALVRSKPYPHVELGEVGHDPVRSTRAELERTAPRHRRSLERADRVLSDYARLDEALGLRLVVSRRHR
jgi:hypothetical protein